MHLRWRCSVQARESGHAAAVIPVNRRRAAIIPDIIHLTHEKPNSIGVEDVREQLVGDVQIRPYNGKYKIYIIPEAEKLTVRAPKNAILEDDRGAAGVCDHFAAHDKRAELSRHDPFQMRAAAAQACAG